MRPLEHDRPQSERGIALVAAILVVMLCSLLVATFMATTTGERSISSNVHVAKEALYAADAGVRTEQQQLANLAQTKIDSCVTAWNAAGGTAPYIITSPATLFPTGTFAVSASNPSFSATGTIAYSDTDMAPARQTFYYHYTIQSSGAAGGAGTRRVQSDGVLQLSAARGNFSDYLMFMQQQTMSNGSNIWFTSSSSMDGRVHSNGIMHFAFNPTFQDLVTSSNSNAMFQNGGSPVTLNANNNGTIDVPNFYNGFQRGQPNVPLPTNAWNQQGMAGNQSYNGTGSPSNSTINGWLGTGSGSSTPPNGIYVPNSGGLATGGIYVQGDLTTCKMWADTTTNKQWYQMVQGATTKTIMVDKQSGVTKVWNGTVTTGTPALSLTNTPPDGVLYVEGGINDLQGPDRIGGFVPPAVAEGTQLLITTQKDIVITNDVTVDSYSKNDAILGLFTLKGGVRVGSGAPNDCNLDAFVMAPATTSDSYGSWSSSAPGQFSVDNYDSGSPRGTFHLRGGIVEQYYGPFFTFDSNSGALQTGMARDYHYDRRGLMPPYYPSTPRFTSTTPTARTVAWKEI